MMRGGWRSIQVGRSAAGAVLLSVPRVRARVRVRVRVITYNGTYSFNVCTGYINVITL